MSYTLPTMRYERFDLMEMPEGLRNALIEYDKRRTHYGIDPCPGRYPTGHNDLDRLVIGLSTMTKVSVNLIARRIGSHCCYEYISNAIPTLASLQGLFWWNGDEDLTAAILQCAWRKGGSKVTRVDHD